MSGSPVARLPGDFARRGWLALLSGVFYVVLCWHPGGMNLFGLDFNGIWFLDTHALLAASDAHALGISPLAHNPLDFSHQPHVYSHWWFGLHALGLSRDDHVWLGLLQGFAFLFVAVLQLGARTLREVILSLGGLVAPCIVLCFARGNADLLVFIVFAATVPLLASSRPTLRWLSVLTILFASGLKFYPAIGGLVLLAPVRPRREAIAQMVVFTVLLALLAYHDAADLSRYRAVMERPIGFFTLGAANPARLLGAPDWAGSFLPWGLGLAVTFFWWRMAPPILVTPERRTEYLRFILGAALLTGCYFITVNYAYRNVFTLFMLPFCYSMWNAPGWPAWFRRVGRGTAVLLVVSLWLDGVLCFFLNGSNQTQAQIDAWTHRLLLVEQPLVAAMMVGLLAFLTVFVRDSLRQLGHHVPADRFQPSGLNG